MDEIEEMRERIRNRITQLRMEKHVSEYRMSYELGRSKSYINNIVSGKSMPALEGLLEICVYFGVTPSEFFEEDSRSPRMLQELYRRAEGLRREDIELLIAMSERLQEKESEETA